MFTARGSPSSTSNPQDKQDKVPAAVSEFVCIQMSPIAWLANLQQLSQKGTGMLE